MALLALPSGPSPSTHRAGRKPPPVGAARPAFHSPMRRLVRRRVHGGYRLWHRFAQPGGFQELPMANASSLHGLMKFLKREEWREAFEETLHAHLFVACKNAGIDMDQLAGILDHHTAMTLWGCAFEDFLARTLPDGRNMVDDYLRRRGYKESASAKAYMKAIRCSVMSLYEVSDIVPGR